MSISDDHQTMTHHAFLRIGQLPPRKSYNTAPTISLLKPGWFNAHIIHQKGLNKEFKLNRCCQKIPLLSKGKAKILPEADCNFWCSGR